MRARLFTAVVPPAGAVDALARDVARLPSVPGLRWTPRSQWHITLGFFGTDDVGARQEWLGPRLAGIAAPRIRLAGSGTFSGVLWCGVGGEDIAELAAAAGADEQRRAFHPHVTLARGRPPGGIDPVAELLGDHRGPRWTASEVVLLRSDRGSAGPVYTHVARYPLSAPPASGHPSAEPG